ncbi:hypothetical protein BKA93DRAFT_880111 [Sparassis latifolia]
MPVGNRQDTLIQKDPELALCKSHEERQIPISGSLRPGVRAPLYFILPVPEPYMHSSEPPEKVFCEVKAQEAFRTYTVHGPECSATSQHDLQNPVERPTASPMRLRHFAYLPEIPGDFKVYSACTPPGPGARNAAEDGASHVYKNTRPRCLLWRSRAETPMDVPLYRTDIFCVSWTPGCTSHMFGISRYPPETRGTLPSTCQRSVICDNRRTHVHLSLSPKIRSPQSINAWWMTDTLSPTFWRDTAPREPRTICSHWRREIDSVFEAVLWSDSPCKVGTTPKREVNLERGL